MSFRDRLNWEADDAVIRSPTGAEMKAAGGKRWESPATPPDLPLVVDSARRVGADGLAIDVQDHGELGPVLTNADQQFTSESDLP